MKIQTFKIEDAMRKSLEKRAKAEGLSLSDIIRLAIRKYLNRKP